MGSISIFLNKYLCGIHQWSPPGIKFFLCLVFSVLFFHFTLLLFWGGEIKKIYWSIVCLQCGVSFRCTAKYISYTYIHYFFEFFSHVEAWSFWCGKVFNDLIKKCRLSTSWVCFSSFVSQEVCPFHLNCWIYWLEVNHNVPLLL